MMVQVVAVPWKPTLTHVSPVLLAFVVQYADLAGAGPLRPEPPTVQPTPQPRLLRRVQSFLKNHVPQKRSPT